MILFSPVSFLPSNVSVGEKRAKQQSPNIWMEKKCKVSQELNVSFQYPHFWHFAVCIWIQAGILKLFCSILFYKWTSWLGLLFFFKHPSNMYVRREWQSTPVLLPGKSHGRRGLVGYSPWGLEESDTTERLHFIFHFHFSLSCIGAGNGNPLQCSCLENPRDRGAWWLLSLGSHRVGHDWSDSAAAAVQQSADLNLYFSL